VRATLLACYANFFDWGTEIGNIARIAPVASYDPWLNFWDPRDPVADPLEPGPAWRLGQPPQNIPAGFFHVGERTDDDDAVTVTPAALHDYKVDNLVENNGAGLRAHNYWDNTQPDGFVARLSELLRSYVATVGTGVPKDAS
jgi:hypothetical protein